MKVLWRVAGYVWRYPGFAVGTLGCAVVSTLLGLVYPRLTGFLIDELLEPGGAQLIGPSCAGLALAFLGRDVLNGIRIVLNNTFEQRVIYDLRSELYGALQALPVGFFDGRQSGDLMTRVTEDVTSMERVLIDGIEQGVVALLQVGVVAGMLVWLQPGLAWMAFAPLPLLVAGVTVYAATAHQRHRVQREAASALNSLLLDNLQGLRQIKSFCREELEQGRFDERNEAVRRGMLGVMSAWAVYSPSMSFFASCGTVFVLWEGSRLVLDGTLTRGELVTFLLYVAYLYEPVGRIHGLNQMVQAGRAAGARVFELLDAAREPEVQGAEREVPWGGAIGGRARGEVRFEGVEFGYRPERLVLRGVHLEAEPGQTVALVGRTGAGKSSLVSLIPRFYEYQAGRVTVDGCEVTRIPLRALRGQIGIVTQEPLLFNGSVRDNLLFGREDATEAEVKAAARAANVWETICRLPEGLATQVGERGIRLSVGEKQRMTIARALLKDPPILILDEATASVDTETEALIQEALRNLLRARTSFVIAHRLSTVRSADQILVLERGTVVERGDHEGLLARDGLYAQLCRVQAFESEL